ncbi:hypothetical protein AB6A40_009709 [Gnathostoma spinigerum]|uniref:carbonic anhydrase n=1 Tax=Gnathostoma spinigerum TaxID=75299 RepID=A0ABD6ESQ7_9BILA
MFQIYERIPGGMQAITNSLRLGPKCLSVVNRTLCLIPALNTSTSYLFHFPELCLTSGVRNYAHGGHWDYNDHGEHGPRTWPNADGHCQSPVNIDLGNVTWSENFEPLNFSHYSQLLSGEIVNNGHSVQVNPKFGNNVPQVSGGGFDQSYQLVQYHFHWSQLDHEGAEHTIGGLHYPMELHLVHIGVKDSSKIAVIGVYLLPGERGAALKAEEPLISRIRAPSSSETISGVNLMEKLPKNLKSFWRYSGSLTTPPCSEIVTWTIFTEPVNITRDQLHLFRQICDRPRHKLEKNFRPVLKLYGREVKQVRTQ